MDDLKTSLEQRAKRFQQLLQDEGYGAKAPVWDEDTKTWDLWVKYESMHVLLLLDADDPEFVRIIVPNFWEVTPDALGAALIAADVTNKKCKVSKVMLNMKRSNTMAVAEFLEEGEQVSARALIRYMDMLSTATRHFALSMREQRAQAEEAA